ncbi:hypothetical protein EPYR_01305 [Erwinia pyrifoliae DSM 12163]|nr:hypothetical protein EPYR_01305 [Erwinia pyrifoliae DSM 12163]
MVWGLSEEALLRRALRLMMNAALTVAGDPYDDFFKLAAPTGAASFVL